MEGFRAPGGRKDKANDTQVDIENRLKKILGDKAKETVDTAPDANKGISDGLGDVNDKIGKLDKALKSRAMAAKNAPTKNHLINQIKADLDGVKKRASGLGDDAKKTDKDTNGLVGLHDKDIKDKDPNEVDISTLQKAYDQAGPIDEDVEALQKALADLLKDLEGIQGQVD